LDSVDVKTAPRESRLRAIQWLILFEALAYGFGIPFVIGLIPEWGRWFSRSPYYAAQVDAFLRHDLALSHSPYDCAFDLTWSEGGVHQVWGLGIPLWRTIWTASARLLGYETFPDGLAMALALSIAAFFVLRALLDVTVKDEYSNNRIFARFGGAIILLGFPPFMRLLKTNVDVYEEAVAYAYLWGILECALLINFLRSPNRKGWFVLMLLSGIGPLVRPTLIFYGISAWIVGSGTYCSRLLLGGNLKLMLVSLLRSKSWFFGSALFGFGLALLLATNWLRFGNLLEFGHKLNLQNIYGSLYATRFDNPIEHQPFYVGAKELTGALFFMRPVEASSFFSPNLFWGQAPVPRMRQMNFQVYDWSYIPWIFVAFAFGSVSLARKKRTRLHVEDSLWLQIVIWAFLSILFLFYFYSRTPALCARYLVDFGAAFATLILVVWETLCRQRSLRLWLGLYFFLVWFGWEATQFIVTRGHQQHRTRQETIQARQIHQPQIPRVIDLGSETASPGRSGIPFDGSGWDLNSRIVKCHVIVFVQDPEFLDLDLAPVPNTREQPEPKWIRAKIGLEFLHEQSVTTNGNGWHVRFSGPRKARYKKGIQVAFIATVPELRLGDEDSPWVLNNIRWR
jgi:hypothetical protein